MRTVTTRPLTPRPTTIRIVSAGASALGLAVTATVALFAIGRASGWLVTADGIPGLAAILGMSIAAPLTATGLVAALVRFVPRPGAVFSVIAAAVYLGLLPGPLTLNAPVATTLVLEAMHLAVALPVVGLLLRAVRAPSGGALPETPIRTPRT